MSKAKVTPIRSAAVPVTPAPVSLADVTVSWQHMDQRVTLGGVALGAVLAWVALETCRLNDDRETGDLDLSPRVLHGFAHPPTHRMRGLAEAVALLADEANDADEAIAAVGYTLRDLTARVQAADEWSQYEMSKAVVTIAPKGEAK